MNIISYYFPNFEKPFFFFLISQFWIADWRVKASFYHIIHKIYQTRKPSVRWNYCVIRVTLGPKKWGVASVILHQIIAITTWVVGVGGSTQTTWCPVSMFHNHKSITLHLLLCMFYIFKFVSQLKKKINLFFYSS